MRGLTRLAETRPPTIGALLDAARCELDALIGDIEGGIRSTIHFDQLEEQASAIAGQLRDAFRRGLR